MNKTVRNRPRRTGSDSSQIKEIADRCEVVPGLPPEEIIQRYFDREIVWSLELDEWNRLTPKQKQIVATAILNIEQETIS
jgi:hypothetical protein